MVLETLLYLWIGLLIAVFSDYDNKWSDGEILLLGIARLVFWPLIFMSLSYGEKND